MGDVCVVCDVWCVVCDVWCVVCGVCCVVWVCVPRAAVLRSKREPNIEEYWE